MPVVVGFIPTDEGKAALDRAVEEAQLRGEKLVVVGSHKGGNSFEKTGETFDHELEDVTKDLTDRGVDFEVHGLVRGNHPAEDLIEIADSVKAKLIVIGLRKRTPVGKLIAGSNAQEVLLNAHCDVLAVKSA